MPRIAISLGASFLGYATHAGFLAGLHDCGVRPVAVAGSSAGALAAGFYAAGLPQEKIKAIVLGHALRLSFAWKTLPVWHAVSRLGFSRQPSFFNSAGAVKQIESLVGDRRIEDLQSPRLTVALTDLTHHRAHFAQSGPLARAMAASCCVPALFSPIEFEGMTCHDGGVAHELPMDFWFEDEGVDVIIAHRIIPPSASRSSFFPMNLIELSGAAHETVSHQLLHYREVLAAKAGKRLIFADTHHARPPLMFGRKLPECYELGYRSAQELHDKTLRPLLDA
jgi:predicted acylesterase/phospholipase RssA